MYGGSQVQTSYIQHSSSDYHNSFSNQKKYGSLNRVNNTSHGFVQNNEVYNRDEKYDARFSSLKRNGSLSARQNNQYSLHSTPENSYEIEGHSDYIMVNRPSSRQSSISHQSSISRNDSISHKKSASHQGSLSRNTSFKDEYTISQQMSKGYSHQHDRELNTMYIGDMSNQQSSSPDASEAIVEEERINPDGSTVLVRRVVTARTTVMSENEASKIEVHISPATETIILPPKTDSQNTSLDYVKVPPYIEGNLNQPSYRDNYEYGRDDRNLYDPPPNYAYHGNSTRSNSNDSSYPNLLNNHVNDDLLNSNFNESKADYVKQENQMRSKSNQARYNAAQSNQNRYNAAENSYVAQDENEKEMFSSNNFQTHDVYNDDKKYASNANMNTVNSNYASNGNIYSENYNNIYVRNNSYASNSNIYIVNGNYASNSNINANLVRNASNLQVFNDQENLNNSNFSVNNQSSQLLKRNVKNNSRIDQQDFFEMSKSNDDESINLHDLLLFLKSNDRSLKSHAAGYLMHLAYNDEEIKIRICELDIIPLLVKLLTDEDEDCYRNAAGALKNLSYGRFLDDNKLAILNSGGIIACSKLLYKTSSIDVREHVTGILYNISSVQSISIEILKECLEIVSMSIIIPLSGWEREYAAVGKKPRKVMWSLLLRNSLGILRNVSSAGQLARIKIRSVEGLIDSMIWILRAAIEQNKQEPESNIINNKIFDNIKTSSKKDAIEERKMKFFKVDMAIVENIMCVLRNLSYNIDREVDRVKYLDALKVSAKDGVENINSSGNTLPHDATLDDSQPFNKNDQRISNKGNVSKKGFLGMKKKPFIDKSKGRMPTLTKDEYSKPPREQWNYLVPVQENQPVTYGVQLLWQQETVTYYTLILKSSINPVTLEAAAAAIHNLCAGDWNWSALLRIHVRLQKGLPPIGDLLTVDQEYVVRAVAHALRNLAIDSRNKWSIGKFIHRNLLSVLPAVTALQRDTKPSEYTICAILSTLQILVYKDQANSRFIKNEGGIEKLVALTKEPVVGIMPQECLRVYSKKVILEANRVLLYMWDFKDCREAIKQQPWSYSKAEEAEKNFKNQIFVTEGEGKDVFAEMEAQDVVKLDSDPRRNLIYADNTGINNTLLQKGLTGSTVQPVGYGDVPYSEVGEQKPLLHSKMSSKKWYKRAAKKEKMK